MPQYYLPLLDFLKIQVAAFLREFISTGRISLDEFIEPKIQVYCDLTGGICSTNCPYFSLDNPCKHRQTKLFAYTIGIVYVLLKMAETSLVYERDFYTAIHTGHRYSEYLDDWKPYDPIEEIVAINSIKKIDKDALVKSSKTNEYKEINKYLNKLNNERKEKIKSVEELIEEFKEREGKVPSVLTTQLKELSNDLRGPNDLSAMEIMKLISSFVDNQTVSEQLIRELITYFIEDFIPVSNEDFPISQVNVDINKLKDSIDKTKYLDDNHPHKWTTDRLDKFRKETDPYKKLLILVDQFKLWADYILPKGIQVTEKLIRAKYLVDTAIGNFMHLGTTKYIIFSTKLYEETNRNRAKKLFRIVCEALKKSLNIDYYGFLTEEQMKYQAILKPKGNTDLILRAFYNTRGEEDQGKALFDIIKTEIEVDEVIGC